MYNTLPTGEVGQKYYALKKSSPFVNSRWKWASPIENGLQEWKKVKFVSGEVKSVSSDVKSIFGELKSVSGKMKSVSSEVKSISSK